MTEMLTSFFAALDHFANAPDTTSADAVPVTTSFFAYHTCHVSDTMTYNTERERERERERGEWYRNVTINDANTISL
jgi:hypothetical protein